MAATLNPSSGNPFDKLPLELVKKILGLNEVSAPRFPHMFLDEAFRGLTKSANFADSIEGRMQALRLCALKRRMSAVDVAKCRRREGVSRLYFTKRGATWNKLGLWVPKCSDVDFGVLLQAAIPYLSDNLQCVAIACRPRLGGILRGWQTSAALDVQLLLTLLLSCKKLVHADFENIHLPASLSPQDPLCQLTKLSLRRLSILTAPELGDMLLRLPNLQDLYISIYNVRFEAAEPCFLKSGTLKILTWSNWRAAAKVLEIRSPFLKRLTLSTHSTIVRLSCPSLARLECHGGGRLESLSPVSGLERITVNEGAGTRLCEILATFPGLKALDIDYWYIPEVAPSIPGVWRLCRSLVQLRLSPGAWEAMCCAEENVPRGRSIDAAKAQAYFEKLEHIHIELSSGVMADPSQSLLKLKAVLGASDRLKQVNISFASRHTV